MTINKLHQDYLSCKGTGHLAGCLGGHITIFHVCLGGHLHWSLCLYVAWGDLIHTTKVSHHVCAGFLACLLPWIGHMVARQE